MFVNVNKNRLHIVNIDNFDEIEYFEDTGRIVLKRVGSFPDSTETLTLSKEEAENLRLILEKQVCSEMIKE